MREGQPRRGRRFAVLALVGFGLAALVLPPPGRPLLVYNGSASLPRGFYLAKSAGVLTPGDLVFAQAPAAMRQLAAQRGYLPFDVPLIKPVAAVAGDHICVTAGHILISGKPVAPLLSSDRAGRPLTSWHGGRVLHDGEIFLLSIHASGSFDSRYFGPVERSAVQARLVPLWTW